MPEPVKVEFQTVGTAELNRAFDGVIARLKELQKAGVNMSRGQVTSSARAVKAVDAQVKAAERAAAREKAIAERVERDKAKAAAKSAATAEKLARQEVKAAERSAAKQKAIAERLERDKAKAAAKAEQIRIRGEERLAAQKMRINERSAIMSGALSARAARADIVAAQKAQLAVTKAHQSRMGSFAGAAGRAGRSTLSTATGVVGGLGLTAGGFAITNAVMSNMRMKQQAALLVNNTRDRSGKATQDSGSLVSEAQRLGQTYGVDSSSVLESMSTVAARAGGAKGLDAYRKDIEDLTKTAVAYGVSMQDMGGVVAAALDAGIESGEPMRKLVQDLVAMGKEGSIEFADLAQELAKLKGAGLQFDMEPGDMLRRMVGFAQIGARAAVSPEESRTAVKDIGRDIVMKSKYLEKSGVNIANEKGQLRDPAAVLADTIHTAMTEGLYVEGSKTRQKGDVALGRVFTGSSKAITSELARIYREGFEGLTGRDAVMGAINTGAGASLAVGERDAALATMMGTESTQFAQNMEKFNAELGKLLPKISALLPTILKATESFAKLVVWAAENPFTALGATFGMYMLKELAAAQIGNLLKNYFTSLPRPGGPGGGGIMPGGVGGKVGGALALAGAGLTGYAIGDAIAPMLMDPSIQEGNKEGAAAHSSYWNMQQVLRNARGAAAKGTLTAQDAENLKAWSASAQEAGAEVAGKSEVSGLNNLNPLAHLEAASYKSAVGVANPKEFEAMAAEFAKLATAAQKATAELDKVKGSDLSNPGNPARGGAPASRSGINQ